MSSFDHAIDEPQAKRSRFNDYDTDAQRDVFSFRNVGKLYRERCQKTKEKIRRTIGEKIFDIFVEYNVKSKSDMLDIMNYVKNSFIGEREWDMKAEKVITKQENKEYKCPFSKIKDKSPFILSTITISKQNSLYYLKNWKSIH